MSYTCPITLQEIPAGEDVAITAVGVAYSPAAIRRWFAAGHVTDPVTKMPLPTTRLVTYRFDGDLLALERQEQRVRDSRFQIVKWLPPPRTSYTRTKDMEYMLADIEYMLALLRGAFVGLALSG